MTAKPYYQSDSGSLYHGGCLEVMKSFEDNTFDTMITDPPYGLSFMGKKWDYDVPSVEIWKQCLRVLKPGATALIFAGSRTQHRMAVNVEDAGFILKDVIMWIYGSGFPKSTDISKQIDKVSKRNALFIPFADHLKLQIIDRELSQTDVSRYFPSKTGGLTGCVSNWTKGSNVPTLKQWKILQPLLNLSNEFLPLIERIEAEREVIGKKKVMGKTDTKTYGKFKGGMQDITAPATNEAKTWNGWGTALKPAYEPILVAMKPNDGTYAQNALKHGVAGLHIDGGRVGTTGAMNKAGKNSPIYDGNVYHKSSTVGGGKIIYNKGRFPANVILDEEAGRLLDEQSGNLHSSGNKNSGLTKSGKSIFNIGVSGISQTTDYKDKGGASRFFYCAKASKSERNAGCEGLEEKISGGMSGTQGQSLKTGAGNTRNNKAKNSHPTVKPLSLMEYLCTLTKTPTGGTVLDPFAGSGTTGLACINTERNYVLIEREEEYCEIIKHRIESESNQMRF